MEAKETTTSKALRRSASLPSWAPMTSKIVGLKVRSPYTALKVGEIRILHLLPGFFGSGLYASLEIETLDNRKDYDDYEAISYAWGEYDLDHAVYLMDGTTVAINASLHAALQYLRHPRKLRRLWADAACINQANLAEKSAQVARMYDVYSRAQQVVVWLGEATKGDIQALSFANAADSAGKSFTMNPFKLATLLYESKTCECCQPEHLGKGCLELRLDCLSSLLQKPWFSRLWVAQEVHAASFVSIQCGDQVVRWDSLPRCLWFFYRFSDLTDWGKEKSEIDLPRLRYYDFYRLREHRNLFADQMNSSLETMMSLIERECSKPHDRVYAMVAILGLDHHAALTPDYAMPVELLYTLFTRVLMLEVCLVGRSYNMYHPAATFKIATAPHRAHRGSTVPSWVPDYEQCSRHIRDLVVGYRLGRMDTDGCFLPDLKRFTCRAVEEDWRKLEVRGRRFAKVAKVFAGSCCPRNPVKRSTEDDADQASALAALLIWYWKCHQQYQSLERADRNTTRFQAFLNASWRSTGYAGSGSAMTPQVFTRLCASLLAEARIPEALRPILETPKERDRLRGVFENLRDPVDGFLLSQIVDKHASQLAWVSPATRAGDKLCYFCGAPLAFVIRRSEEQGCFGLVGDAWVLEVTDWQALGTSEGEFEAVVLPPEELPYEMRSIWTPEHFQALLSRRSADPEPDCLPSEFWDLRTEEQKRLGAWERDNVGWITLV